MSGWADCRSCCPTSGPADRGPIPRSCASAASRCSPPTVAPPHDRGAGRPIATRRRGGDRSERRVGVPAVRASRRGATGGVGSDAPSTTAGWTTRRRCPATGPCRASATSRTTRTCRCRSPARRRGCPTRNPTGVYRRTFTVPAAWRGRQVVLHVGGAESVHAVYVNGAFVGYGTDSRLASEYDITAAPASPARNDLAIVVVRYSAHSYVEDQDQWWMAGLHREVALVGRGRDAHRRRSRATPGFRVADGVGHARRVGHGRFGDERRSRRAGRSARPSRRSAAAGWRRRSPRRCRIASPTRTCSAVTSRSSRFELAGVDPWSAERPTRYRVVVELLDPDGAVVEVHAQLDRLPHGRGPRRRPAGQRAADLDPRRQPPRPPSRPRQGGHGRRHARRPARRCAATTSPPCAARTTRTTRGSSTCATSSACT